MINGLAKDLLWTTIIFLILIFVFLFLPWLFVRLKSKKLATISLAQLLKEAKIGDLLATSNNDFNTQMLSIFTQSIWSHVVIIFVDSDRKYVVEVDKKGFRQSFLEEWIKFHQENGDKIIWVKRAMDENILNGSNENVLEGKEMCKHLNEFIGEKNKLNGNYLSWLAGRCLNSPVNITKGKNSVYCSEFVATMLQKMNIITSTKHASLYTPGELVDGKFKLKFPARDSYTARKLALEVTGNVGRLDGAGGEATDI